MCYNDNSTQASIQHSGEVCQPIFPICSYRAQYKAYCNSCPCSSRSVGMECSGSQAADPSDVQWSPRATRYSQSSPTEEPKCVRNIQKTKQVNGWSTQCDFNEALLPTAGPGSAFRTFSSTRSVLLSSCLLFSPTVIVGSNYLTTKCYR